MKVAPNLNFTEVKPEQKSLGNFVQMIKNIYQNFTQAFNGNIGFGDGTNADNINGTWINVVAPVAPNTDFTVDHNLGRLPVGYWIMQKDRACDVYTGGVASTTTALTLRATVASAVLRLFIIGLLLSFFIPRGETQVLGANHFNTATKIITPSGSSGISGGVVQPIAGAVITVCKGSVLPAPGITCTGLAQIFSNQTLATPLSNPTNADNNGNYSFYVNSGQPYIISVSGTGLTTYSYSWTAQLVTGVQVQVFGLNGTFTFTIPAPTIKITIVGAGGAGGGSTVTNNGGGGGSGGVAIKWLTGLTPGNTLSVVVGQGGAGVSATTGGAGTASSISSGTQIISTITANGGFGGFCTGATSSGGPGSAPSVGGDISGGGAGGVLGTAGIGGNGGSTIFGGGGSDASAGAPGNPALGVGGGGGGASAGSNQVGGGGANGTVFFEWVN